WQQTVEATNLFLSAHQLPAILHLTDHYPYRIASAKLQGADALTRFKLAVEGLFFAGEPNLLRRTRCDRDSDPSDVVSPAVDGLREKGSLLQRFAASESSAS
ncbi:hypothetical protein ACC685_36115, partial [Rhizobium ruizarguesonis]